MAKVPIIDEREFLKLTQNHGEFRRKLQTLGLGTASADVTENVHHVGLCWLRLAVEHLEDAKAAVGSGRNRSAYSRAYYSAYNASKSVRYIVAGAVSLHADDHKKAPDLPDDFPDVEKWADGITRLYEIRLRADYDNWTSTGAELSLTAPEAVRLAEAFLTEVGKYLETKCGIKP